MKVKIILCLFFCITLICFKPDISACVLETSGTLLVVQSCSPGMLVSHNLAAENGHAYTFHGFCSGEYGKWEYTLHALWNPTINKAYESYDIDANTAVYHYSIMGNAGGDPWLYPQTPVSNCMVNSDPAVMYPPVEFWQNCPSSKSFLNQNQRQNLISELEQIINTPADPTNLNATVTPQYHVLVTWQDNANNESSYQLYRAKTNNGGFEVIATLGANVVQYLDTALPGAGEYCYKVNAHSGGTYTSTFSNTDCVTVIQLDPKFLGPFKPKAPTQLNATTISSSQIDLTWVDNSDDEVGFKIDRSEKLVWHEVASLNPNTTHYSDTSLQPSSNYMYRVSAYNDKFHSDYSNIASANTGKTEIEMGQQSYNRSTGLNDQTNRSESRSAGQNDQAGGNNQSASGMADPSNLSGKALTSTSIKLTWKDTSANEQGFILERKAFGEQYKEIKKLKKNATKYIDKTVKPGNSYSYRLKAYSGNVVSGYSNEITITTPKEEKSAKTKKTTRG